MKYLITLLLIVCGLALSCNKTEFAPIDTSTEEVQEPTIPNEFMELLLSKDTIPIEVFQKYTTGDLQSNNQRVSCTVVWGQSCNNVEFTTYPGFSIVLNWTENDNSVQLLYFSPDTACITSSLPAQSIVGSFVILVDFGGGLIKTFKIYRFIPSRAPVGEYRVIVKDECSCSSQIKIGIKIHEVPDTI